MARSPAEPLGKAKSREAMTSVPLNEDLHGQRPDSLFHPTVRAINHNVALIRETLRKLHGVTFPSKPNG